MKYARLTKEQLEELHPEFITFLATQSIDKKEWDEIKQNKPPERVFIEVKTLSFIKFYFILVIIILWLSGIKPINGRNPLK